MKFAILTVRTSVDETILYSATVFEGQQFTNSCTSLSDEEYICVTVYDDFKEYMDDIEIYKSEGAKYSELIYM